MPETSTELPAARVKRPGGVASTKRWKREPLPTLLSFQPIVAQLWPSWMGHHYEPLLRMEDEVEHPVLPGNSSPAAEHHHHVWPSLDRWQESTALDWLSDNLITPVNLSLCSINLVRPSRRRSFVGLSAEPIERKPVELEQALARRVTRNRRDRQLQTNAPHFIGKLVSASAVASPSTTLAAVCRPLSQRELGGFSPDRWRLRRHIANDRYPWPW